MKVSPSCAHTWDLSKDVRVSTGLFPSCLCDFFFFILVRIMKDQIAGEQASVLRKEKKKKKEKEDTALPRLNHLVGVELVQFPFTDFNCEYKCTANVLSRWPKSTQPIGARLQSKFAWAKEKPPNLWEHTISNNFSFSYAYSNSLS